MFEVNLVPDVKRELLHKQRLGNFVIGICIFVVVGCVGVLLILGSVVGGQGIALSAQDTDLKDKSNEILTFQNVNQVLTLQDQLNKISGINENKKVLSRLFGVLDVILPIGDDEVTISELSIDLEESEMNFDGQADSPGSNIDYRALETFKKTAELTVYDYGRYMDEEGNEIPTMCINEVTENGIVYGVYRRSQKGCGEEEEQKEDEVDAGADVDVADDEETEDTGEEEVTPSIPDIRIKRDMTRDELEKAKDKGDYYFESQCVTFEEDSDGKWKTANECLLLAEPMNIMDSSNGRNSADELVLRFSASLKFDSAIFEFGNKHMRVIGPARQNVTDSYVQIRDMFDSSKDCEPDDTACLKGNG